MQVLLGTKDHFYYFLALVLRLPFVAVDILQMLPAFLAIVLGFDVTPTKSCSPSDALQVSIRTNNNTNLIFIYYYDDEIAY